MSTLHFKYQAFDTSGKVQQGQLSAESERDAIRLLQNRNLTPVKLSPKTCLSDKSYPLFTPL